MDSATWCRTPAAASAARRLRPEVWKNSSTALSSNEGELARSITTCAPAVASLSPSPVMVLTPLLGEAATTSWPRWRRMATVFEPLAGGGVAAAMGEAGDDLVPALAQNGDGLRADQASAADDDDLHGLPSLVDDCRPLNANTSEKKSGLNARASCKPVRRQTPT